MLVGAILIGLMGILVLKSALANRADVSTGNEGSPEEACPSEFVASLFSDRDVKFVAALDAPEVLRMFRKERRLLAMQWIEQTRAQIRRIMREHKTAARRSTDLAVRTELLLAAQHLQLVLLCQALAVSIQMVDPPTLRHVALHADRLAERLAESHRAFERALGGREGIGNAGPA